MKLDPKGLEAAMKVPFIELPDDLREPLHSLQADLDWLFARVAADGSVASIMRDSVSNRLSQIETASYRLANFTTAPSDGKAATAEPGEEEDDWRDDPSADDRWNAGCGYAQEQLCKVLGVDPQSIDWDAATETLDGDVQSVTCKILTAGLGEEWAEHTAPPSAEPSSELVERLRAIMSKVTRGDLSQEEGRAIAEAISALSQAQPPETDAVAAERGASLADRLRGILGREWGRVIGKEDSLNMGRLCALDWMKERLEVEVAGLDALTRARTDAATGGE